MDTSGWVLTGVLVCVALYLHEGVGVWSRSFSEPGQGIILLGDPEALERSFVDLFNPWAMWRTQWKWQLLRVENRSRYCMHYRGGMMQEDFSKALMTRYVAVRISPDDVRFWATRAGIGGDGVEVILNKVGTPFSKQGLKFWCREQGIDPDADVSWI